MFNTPLPSLDQELNPIDKFIIDNWLMLLIISIILPVITTGVIYILSRIRKSDYFR